MFVFLSYAREDGDLAERIRRTLVAAGFDCFLDTKSLPPGQEYNARIGQAIARADLFVFLSSAAALEPGSYALTELAFAEKKWRNPAGYVLPVTASSLDLGTLPAYLRPINVLQPRGNIEAEVLAWVEERAEHGGGGPGEPTGRDRLTRWVRQHQPPLRRQRRLVARSFVMILAGVALIAFSVFASSFNGPRDLAPEGYDAIQLALTVIPMLVGGGVVVFALVQTIRGLVGAKPIAALVLDRSEDRGVTVHLLLADDTRKTCSAVGQAAASAFPGEIGWAFVTGGLLLGFEHGRPQSGSGHGE
jgi:hypothetical protein